MLYLNRTTFGRPLTAEETSQITDYLFGITNTAHVMNISSQTVFTEIGSYTDNTVYAFDSQTVLDGYVSLVQSFTPAPTAIKTLS